LLDSTYDANDVYIDGQGWFIFGGENGHATSQKLVGIDSKWEEGPNVLAKNISKQCVVKVNQRHFLVSLK